MSQDYAGESIYDMDPELSENNNEPEVKEKVKVDKGEDKKLQKEISIYELNAGNDGQTENKEQQKMNPEHSFTYLANERKLCFIGNDADFIPTELIYEFGLKALVLDISFNRITDLRDLSQFPNLEELICDNNLLTDDSQFPKLNNLKLFSCNKNYIENIHTLVDKLRVFFPHLTYLSLMGNKACPNQLIDQSKDEFDYSRYRKYVLHRLKNLKFLDSYEVTHQERELVSKEALFYDTVKYNEKGDEEQQSNERTREQDSRENYAPLPKDKQNDANNKSSFGYTKYIYHGKQSEGNRFIRNDDL